MPQHREPQLITVEEAARRLCIGRTACYLLVLKGELASIKIGRTRRVVAAAIDTYITQHLTVTGTGGQDARPDAPPCGDK